MYKHGNQAGVCVMVGLGLGLALRVEFICA